MGSALGLINTALLTTLPVPGPIPVDADSLRRELESWDVDRPPPPIEGKRVSKMRPHFRHLRLYSLGLLSSRVEDYEAAIQYASELEAIEPIARAPTAHMNLALEVRADVLLRQGHPAEALAALERAPWRTHYAVQGSLPRRRGVFLRARALQDLKRYQEALQWYDLSGTGGTGPALLAPSHLYRGEIYEELGDAEKALWHYSQFVKLWRDADPEYQPVVEEVKGHMARLAAEG